MPESATAALNEIAIQRLVDGGSRSLLYRDIDGVVRVIPIAFVDSRLTRLLENALTIAGLMK